MEEPKMGRFRKSWLLTRGAWRALILDKELLWIPVIGTMVSLAVLTIGIVAGTLSNGIFYETASTARDTDGGITLVGYIALLALGAILTAISTVTAGAVIHGAIERFRGNDPTIQSSISAAWGRALPLTSFALFSYTIGTIISFIAERIPFGGRIVEWLGHTAWGIASFFAIPVIVTSDQAVGPVDATKRSFGVLRSVWGESLIISATIGLVGLIAAIVYIVTAGFMFAAVSTLGVPDAISLIWLVLTVAGLFGFALVFTVLEAFVKAALYHYATTGESPRTFDSRVLRQTFTQKKAHKVFGA